MVEVVKTELRVVAAIYLISTPNLSLIDLGAWRHPNSKVPRSH